MRANVNPQNSSCAICHIAVHITSIMDVHSMTNSFSAVHSLVPRLLSSLPKPTLRTWPSSAVRDHSEKWYDFARFGRRGSICTLDPQQLTKTKMARSCHFPRAADV